MDIPSESSDAVGEQLKQHNNIVMAEIDARIANGLRAALKADDYYVIRNRFTGVLSVLTSATVDDAKAVVFGPAGFPLCIRHVNAAVLGRLAETDGLEMPRTNQEVREK